MFKRTGRTSYLILPQLIAVVLSMAGAAQATDAGAHFVRHATAGNTGGPFTTLHHPLANGNPDAIVLVTQNWNPGGGVGIYNDHSIGVAYTGADWSIFNRDGAAMREGASFKVTAVDPPFFADDFETGDTSAWSATTP